MTRHPPKSTDKSRECAEEEEDAPLLVPSPSKDKHRASRATPASFKAGKTHSPAGEQNRSEGNTAPRTEDHRDKGGFTSPPEREEDSGASHMGASSEHTMRFCPPPTKFRKHL
jgi:hypothetical protein